MGNSQQVELAEYLKNHSHSFDNLLTPIHSYCINYYLIDIDSIGNNISGTHVDRLIRRETYSEVPKDFRMRFEIQTIINSVRDFGAQQAYRTSRHQIFLLTLYGEMVITHRSPTTMGLYKQEYTL